MIKASFRLSASNATNFKRFAKQRVEQAALFASDRGAAIARSEIKAGLKGRLGGAIGHDSDLKRGRGVYRRADGSSSASGVVFVRGGDRAKGAVKSATEGGDIIGVKSPWLWIASPDLQKRVGIKGQKGTSRLTPALYNRTLANRIGPLVKIPGRHAGESLLIVKDVTVRLADGRNPRRLPMRGGIRPGRYRVDQFVAFVGILRTSRTAYLDPRAIFKRVQNVDLKLLIEEGLKRGTR